MNKAKELLRAKLKERRLNLELDLRRDHSEIITASLKTIADWGLAKSIHIYEPILLSGEVDISAFTTYLKINYPNIRLHTSRKIDGAWMIVDLAGNATESITYDYVIVPMLGFDESLERIGQGGGYYDRFLKRQSDAKKIGVCFEVGRIKEVPKEAHDVPMDVIVSEKRIYYKNP